MGSTSEPKVLEPPAPAESRARFRSDRASGLNESVIREMTRLAFQYDAVNLAQGYPDFPAPAILKRAAIEAIEADINQYSITWGAKPFRDAIAAKYRDLERDYGLTGGHPLHAEPGLDQFYLWRPLLGHARYRIGGIDGLYLCGSGGHPGGGVTGGPGQNAAREILADARKRR